MIIAAVAEANSWSSRNRQRRDLHGLIRSTLRAKKGN